MKNLSLLFILFSTIASAQIYEGFDDLAQLPCPYDTTSTIYLPSGWELYQTTNDRWNGKRDSSVCLSFESQEAVLNFDQVDVTKRVFMKKDYEPQIQLFPDNLYNTYLYLQKTGEVQLANDSCGLVLCSGLRWVIRIPNQDSTGYVYREQTSSIPADDEFWLQGCMASEYFDDQHMASCVIELTIEEVENGSSLTFLSVELLEVEDYWTSKIYEVNVPESASSGNEEYHMELYEITQGYGLNYLFMYDTTTYPLNTHFIDANLEVNKTSPQDIYIYAEPYEGVYFQPKVELRGGLVENDTLRHNLHFVNNGSDICLDFIEVGFSNSGGFLYRGGHIDFSHKLGCFRFEDKSTLTVDKGFSLQYGNAGKGVMYMKDNSKIIINNKASLEINSNLLLGKSDNNNPLQIELNKGGHIEFTEHASITDSKNSSYRKINIINKGGTVDITSLSTVDQLRFDIEDQSIFYPSPERFLSLWQSSSSNIDLTIKSDQNQLSQITIHDLSGKQLISIDHHLFIGLNALSVPFISESAGMFIVQVKLNDGKVDQCKFVMH